MNSIYLVNSILFKVCRSLALLSSCFYWDVNYVSQQFFFPPVYVAKSNIKKQNVVTLFMVNLKKLLAETNIKFLFSCRPFLFPW